MELTKGANAPLGQDEVVLTLAWQGSVTLDVSALLLGPDGKVRSDDDFIFYNQPSHFSGAVAHLGATGVAGQRDSIGLSLGRVETAIDRIVVTASAGGIPFGEVPGLRLDVLHTGTLQPLVGFPISASTETALIAGEVYRRNGQWKFRAVGQGYDSGLRGIAEDFGITVDEEELLPEPRSPTALPVPVVTPRPDPGPPQVPASLPHPRPNTATPSPAEPPAAEPEDDEADVKVQPWPTDNPYYKKLFTMKEFGRAPGRAVKVFRDRMVDPEEKLLAAFKSQHGPRKWGYVIITTEGLRWFETIPFKGEEFYPAPFDYEHSGSMIRTPDGNQFQLKGFGAGRKFNAIIQVVNNAERWDDERGRG